MSGTYRTKVLRGKTLRRVREVQERAAKAEANEAQNTVEERALEENRKRAAMRDLDQATMQEANGGMSMRNFLQYQDIRALHEHAIDLALLERQKAADELQKRRAELRSAVHERRAAERLLASAEERFAVEQKRQEQKVLDDINCARADNQAA